ncbi:SDR family oxidoreductase [Pantoea agglomerans]|uniref:SDR family oxidoreductase n=1 Tax=Enterobacter agglomerans TaxID=549 RepID=UPI003C7D333E
MVQSPQLSTIANTITPARTKIVVVGATGFLGAKVLHNLALEKDASVVAMSRKGSPSGGDAIIEWVRGDMMDPASLDRVLQGVDVVVSTANSYMKGSLDTDFQGNKNLIEAAARAKVSRFVFLSIVNCEAASAVPHFHAKKVAEDLIKKSGVPYVFVRAPSFLDQSTDFIAKAVKAGKFQGIGDKATRWSYVLTDDLASYLAKAATYSGTDIVNQTIDVGWSDGPKNQQELADIISNVINKRLKIQIIPWWVVRVAARPVRLFSELGYDLIQMFLFFRTGLYVSETSGHERFFGPAPTAHEAITRWARNQQLIT